jgi:hypothetical protein
VKLREAPVDFENPLFGPFVKQYLSHDVKHAMCGNTLTSAYKGMMEYTTDTVGNIDDGLLGMTIAYMKQHFSSSLKYMRKTPIYDVLEGINASTSAGFICMRNACPSKGSAVSSGIIYQLEEEYMNIPIYWSATVKEELRKLSKIEEDNLRLFLVAPFEQYVVEMIYYKSFIDEFNMAHQDTFSGVGISKYELGFHRAVREILDFPFKDMDDYKKFDKKMLAKLIKAVLRAWNSFFSSILPPRDRERIRKMNNAIINSICVMPDGHVYMKLGGVPSGSAITTVLNTVLNWCVQIYTFLKIHGPLNYKDLMINLAEKLCGDDVLMGTNSMAFYFNARAKIIYEDFGLVVTSPTPMFKEISELEFLSQKMLVVKGVYMPLPDGKKAIDSLLKHTIKNRLEYETWDRLCGLVLEYHWCPETHVLDLFAEYMMEKYQVDSSKYFNPVEREALYFGYDVGLYSKRDPYKNFLSNVITTESFETGSKAKTTKEILSKESSRAKTQRE